MLMFAPTSIWSNDNFGVPFFKGCWGLHFQDWEAWSCQVPLCRHWHFQWKEAWGYCSFISQLRRKLSHLAFWFGYNCAEFVLTICFLLASYRFHMFPALSISWLIFLKTDTYVCFQHLAFLPFNCLFGNAYLFITSGEVTLQVSLLTESGNTKDDLKLPTDENLQAQVSALAQTWSMAQQLSPLLLLYQLS